MELIRYVFCSSRVEGVFPAEVGGAERLPLQPQQPAHHPAIPRYFEAAGGAFLAHPALRGLDPSAQSVIIYKSFEAIVSLDYVSLCAWYQLNGRITMVILRSRSA